MSKPKFIITEYNKTPLGHINPLLRKPVKSTIKNKRKAGERTDFSFRTIIK